MARPTKQGIDYFPLWKPHMRTEEKFSGTSQKAYRAFKDKKLLSLLNTYQNLQILCKSCNAAKLPED